MHKFHETICFQSLPVAVKRRIKALKKLQLQYTDLEAAFYKEVHALEVSEDRLATEHNNIAEV